MTDHLTFDELNDLADGVLPEPRQAEVQAHLRACAGCAAGLAGLRATLDDLQSLDAVMAPPEELWTDIRASIDAGKVALLGTDTGRARSGWWMTPGRAAAAALLLIAGSSAVTAVLLRETAPPAITVDSDGGSAAVTWQVAERGYLTSVLDLRAQLAAHAEKLAPTTIAAIERSLATIDVAIAEAREALLRDPANAALPELLASNYRQKIELLRRATQLASST